MADTPEQVMATHDRAIKLEANFLSMQQQIEANKVQNALEHADLKSALTDGLKTIESKLDKALAGKANKWVEKVLTLIGTAILVGFLTYLGTLIYSATVHLSQ